MDKPFYAPEEPDPEFRETWEGGHALIIQYGDCEFIGSCQCGQHLLAIGPDESFDKFSKPWERHTMSLPR
jgi:hypothetical protein